MNLVFNLCLPSYNRHSCGKNRTSRRPVYLVLVMFSTHFNRIKMIAHSISVDFLGFDIIVLVILVDFVILSVVFSCALIAMNLDSLHLFKKIISS